MDKLALCNAALLRCGAEQIASLVDTSKRAKVVVNQYEITLRELLADSPWNFATKKIRKEIQKVAITSWSNVGKVVTLVVPTGHGYVANDIISVSGLLCDSSPPITNGVKIDSVTATQIVYTAPVEPTGTPTISTGNAYATASDLFGYRFRYALPSDHIRILEVENKIDFRVESNGIMCNTDTAIQLKYIYYHDDPTKYSGSFMKAFVLKLAEDISYSLVQSASLQGQISAEAERYLRKARSMNSQEGTPESRYPQEFTLGVRQ